ncbi:MAG: HDOD domain-containing protein [Candidatus Krumholzibacteriota bacterium]|nr:HDOD domain-containing protein [Candidatus Krumholzibacteriota bacterium]
MNRREAIISKLPLVRAIPGTAINVMKILQDPEFEIDDLLEAIEYNQGLTSNLLRMANSAMFGAPGFINNMKDAVTRLGANNIYRMTVASVVSPSAKQKVEGYDLEAGDLWLHSVSVALCTERLAKKLKLRVPPYSFTAAILHDIGKIVLGSFLEIDSAPINFLVRRKGYTLFEAEKKILGIDHAEVGALLLARWNIPDEIISIARWHHEPEKCRRDCQVAQMIHLADTISMRLIIGQDDTMSIEGLPRGLIEKFAIDEELIETVISETLDLLEKSRDLYQIELPTPITGDGES